MSDAWETKLGELLPRGVEGAEERAPKAQWARPDRLHPKYDYLATRTKGALFLGERGGKWIGWQDDRHVLMCAGSRAGKGVSLIEPNLHLYVGSVLVVDPKGELAKTTSAHRRDKLGQRVVVLDPFKVTDLPSTGGWNPLADLDLDHPECIDDVVTLAEAMVQIPEGARDTHWALAAQQFLTGLILMTLTLENEIQRTIITVRDLLMLSFEPLKAHTGAGSMKSEWDALIAMMHAQADDCMEMRKQADGSMEPKHSDARQDAGLFIEGIAATYKSMAEKERESVLSTARAETGFLSSTRMRAVLSANSLSLRELKRDRVTLYICLPAGRMGSHAKWLRIIIAAALQAMEREKTTPDVPVLFVLDEFNVLGHMRSIEVAAGQLAGFGVKLWTIIQDLGQLKNLYQNNWQTFVGNAGVLVFFGNSDTESLDYISAKLGERELVFDVGSGATISARSQGARLTQEQRQMVGLWKRDEAERALNRDNKTALVMAAGRRPLIIRRVLPHDASDTLTAAYWQLVKAD